MDKKAIEYFLKCFPLKEYTECPQYPTHLKGLTGETGKNEFHRFEKLIVAPKEMFCSVRPNGIVLGRNLNI